MLNNSVWYVKDNWLVESILTKEMIESAEIVFNASISARLVWKFVDRFAFVIIRSIIWELYAEETWVVDSSFVVSV